MYGRGHSNVKISNIYVPKTIEMCGTELQSLKHYTKKYKKKRIIHGGSPVSMPWRKWDFYRKVRIESVLLELGLVVFRTYT